MIKGQYLAVLIFLIAASLASTVSTTMGSATAPYSVDFDLKNMTGFNDNIISADDIVAYIQDKYPISPMLSEADIGSCFINAGLSNNVNPAFLVATADLEGKFGTAGWAASNSKCHNTMGYDITDTGPGSYSCADSWCAMIQRVASVIATSKIHYYSQGNHTISQVRKTYATNSNPYSIASLMDELYESSAKRNGSNNPFLLPASPQPPSQSESQPATGQPNYITYCIPNDKQRDDKYNRIIQYLYSADLDTVREGIIDLDSYACSDQRPYCQFKDTRAVDPLIRLLNKTRSDKDAIIEILGCIGDNRAVDPLIQILKNESEEDYIREDAAKYLGLLKDPRAVDPLIQVLNDASVDRPTVIGALGAIKDSRAVDSLIQILEKDKNNIDRGTAATALGNINDSRAVEPLIQALNDEEDPARGVAAEALGMIKDTRAVDPLIQALNDKDYLVRSSAATALGSLGDAKAINPLKEALNDNIYDVKLSASKAIKKLEGKG